MSENPRARRVAERIKVIAARTLEREVKDPRLGFVTITDVRVTGDLQHASIFYTVYGSDKERADSSRALTKATGVVRREVGKGLSLRLTPSIEFILDALPETASSLEQLLRDARARDAEAAAAAAGATFAGDADPYRKPRELGDDEDDGDNAAELHNGAPGGDNWSDARGDGAGEADTGSTDAQR